MHRLLFASSALTAIPIAAWAQAQAAVEEVVVSATRLATPGSGKPYSVATISSGQLAGSQSVTDALSRLSGIYVQAPGGRSGVASVFLRGADPNFTAVFLDGVPLNDSTNSRGGSVNMSEIDTGALERIEVVAGPMSSLYGSGALAGAINLAVPGGNPRPELQATLGAGTSGDYSGTVRLAGPLPGQLGGSVALTGSNDGVVSPGSQFTTWSVTSKIAAMDASKPGRLILRVSGSDSDAFPDSSGGPRLANRRTLQNLKGNEALAGLDLRVVSQGAFSLNLQGSYLHRRDDTASPGVAPSPFNGSGIPVTVDTSTYSHGSLQAVTRYSHDNWSAASGIEAQREAGHSRGELVYFGVHLPSAFHMQRDIFSAFAESSYVTRAWAANFGARADGTDGLGTHVTARAGLSYALPTTGLSLRVTAGTGFKAPSFYALGNPLVGNARLLPERSKSGEFGLVWSSAENLEATVTWFRARYRDLIDFDPGPPPRLMNRSEVDSTGIAATIALPVNERLNVYAQTQYATTVDDTGTQLLSRPKWRATAGVSWTATSTLSFELQSSYISKRNDYSIPTGVRTLNPYQLFSVAGALSMSASTNVRLIVDNALDRSYEEAVGFPAPAIRARLLLTQRF